MGKRALVWDWPLRLWHWLFALCLTGSLVTGLSDDIGLMERHLQLGNAALGLLLFRVAWAVWGPSYVRWHHYRIAPAQIRAHFRGTAHSMHRDGVLTPHTAPGAALSLVFVCLVAAQVATGLFATDDIFTYGPLNSYVEAETAQSLSWLHRRIFWLILTAIAVHLTAHIVYAIRGDDTPRAMFSGRKSLELPDTQHRVGVAIAIASGLFGLLWLFGAYV